MIFACDVDGTICDSSHRHHLFEKDGRVELAAYFDPELVAKDKPFPIAQEALYRIVHTGHRVVFTTGRSEYGRAVTTKWLKDHFPFLGEPNLLMRPTDASTVSAGELKAGFFDALSKEHNTLIILDDLDECLAAGARFGLALKAPNCWDKLRLVSPDVVFFG